MADGCYIASHREHFHDHGKFFWALLALPCYPPPRTVPPLSAWMVAPEHDRSICVSAVTSGNQECALSVNLTSSRCQRPTLSPSLPSPRARGGSVSESWGVRLTLSPFCYSCGKESGPHSGSWAGIFRKCNYVFCV